MTYNNILVEDDNGIIILTINRPKALNALSWETLEEIKYFFGEDGPSRKGMKGVILTGSGDRAFVAGADIKEFLELDATKGAAMAKRGQDIYFSIERFHVPVIAAVNGFALGGGCELAMACHMRIAGEKAKFGQPEVNLGLIPGYGGTQRMIQYVGKTKAMELTLTGDLIDANEAYRLGLVNHVVAQGQEVEKAKEIIEKTATKGPIAIQKAIEAINAYFQEGVDGFEAEIKKFSDLSPK